MKNGKVGIGFVGVGVISDIYLTNITSMFHEIEVVGVCDLIREKAERGAAKYGVKKIYKDMYELFADDEVDIVLNITRPYEHYEVTKAALMAGKHVYSEKPLSPDLSEGIELVNLAKEKGLFLGGAPDTFMGAGIQTARKVIDDGFIGKVIGGRAMFSSHGPEDWHPDCEFVYKYGGGPMFDMGPYYVTALVNLLGRAETVSGYTKTTFPERPMLCGPKFGNMMDVSVPTYVMGEVGFECGAVVSVFTTFDVFNTVSAMIELYGTEGSIRVPDPNTFGGKVEVLRGRSEEYLEIPLLFDYPDNSRALGLADMAKAVQTGRMHRANYMQQLHVLEVMSSFEKSSNEGRRITLTTPYERQKPMDATKLTGYLD